MKKNNELLYEAWNDHLKNTRERTNYSIRRFDLLIISISGAGIYVVFETLKELKSGTIKAEFPKLLLIAGILFLISIISNFISQRTGYAANNNEESYINLELQKIRGKKIDECLQESINKKVSYYNLWTTRLNYLSMILMLLGLVLSVVFNYSLF